MARVAYLRLRGLLRLSIFFFFFKRDLLWRAAGFFLRETFLRRAMVRLLLVGLENEL